MQKFTVFTILLSISILLIIGDLVFNDYLGKEAMPVQENPLEQPEAIELEEPSESAYIDLDLLPEETSAGIDLVELSSEVPASDLFEDTFVAAGFANPSLKEALFSGYLFQFISLIDQTEATTYYWNLFDGESYVGSITEMKYPSQTASLQAYLSVLERAKGLAETGVVNEVNAYGDGSFYFNHNVKKQTVHLVIRKGETIYGFEYAYLKHETMKNLFDFL